MFTTAEPMISSFSDPPRENTTTMDPDAGLAYRMEDVGALCAPGHEILDSEGSYSSGKQVFPSCTSLQTSSESECAWLATSESS